MGGLLCPRPLMQEAMKPFLSLAGLLGVEVLDENRREAAVRELAEIFDVNPAVTTHPDSGDVSTAVRPNAPLKFQIDDSLTVSLHCTNLW